MCTLRPVVVSTEEAVEDIRAWLKEAVEDIRAWLNGEPSQQDYGSLFDLTGLLFILLELWGMKGEVK